MSEQLHIQQTPNHEAMNEVAPIIDAFKDAHGLGERVRIDAAGDSLGKIENQVGGKRVDTVVAELINETVEADSEDAEEAVEIGVVNVLERPDSPRTIFELGQAPHDMVVHAMHDLNDAKGDEATEEVIEAIETQERAHAEQQDALWRTMADYTESNSVYAGKSAKVKRLPVSLPVRNFDEYDSGVVQYVEGDDLEDVLKAHGVGDELIEAAKTDGWNIPVDQLPKELRHTMGAATVYELVTMSHDEEVKRAASERNASVTLEDIWEDSTLHHVTKSGRLGAILKDGQLGYADVHGSGYVQSTGGSSYSGSLNFARNFREVSEGATNSERMDALSYNNRGDVYIHYTRHEGCYREGEEYIDTDLIAMMPVGMPATEISALMIRNSNDAEALESTWGAVEASGMYIPIFDADGNKLYTKEDFDAGKIPDVVQSLRNYQRQEAERAEINRQEQQMRFETEQLKHAEDAAARGMTLEEHAEWRRQNMVRPQI